MNSNKIFKKNIYFKLLAILLPVLVFGLFEVNIDKEKCIISSNVFGEEFKKSKHKIGMEIKAITYHMLEVKIDKPYSVQILFDIRKKISTHMWYA